MAAEIPPYCSVPGCHRMPAALDVHLVPLCLIHAGLHPEPVQPNPPRRPASWAEAEEWWQAHLATITD